MGFLCVPARVGVEDNEAADRVSRTSYSRDSVDVEVPFSRMECRSIVSERSAMAARMGGRQQKEKAIVEPKYRVSLSRQDDI